MLGGSSGADRRDLGDAVVEDDEAGLDEGANLGGALLEGGFDGDESVPGARDLGRDPGLEGVERQAGELGRQPDLLDVPRPEERLDLRRKAGRIEDDGGDPVRRELAGDELAGAFGELLELGPEDRQDRSIAGPEDEARRGEAADRREPSDGPGQGLDEGPILVESGDLALEASPLAGQAGDRPLGLDDGLDDLEEGSIVEGPERLDEIAGSLAPADEGGQLGQARDGSGVLVADREIRSGAEEGGRSLTRWFERGEIEEADEMDEAGDGEGPLAGSDDVDADHGPEHRRWTSPAVAVLAEDGPDEDAGSLGDPGLAPSTDGRLGCGRAGREQLPLDRRHGVVDGPRIGRPELGEPGFDPSRQPGLDGRNPLGSLSGDPVCVGLGRQPPLTGSAFGSFQGGERVVQRSRPPAR